MLLTASKDQDAVDDNLPEALRAELQYVATVVSTLALIVIALPIFLVVLLPIALVYYWMGLYYSRTSRELKRLDSLLKSPVFAQLSETLSGGIPTIRAYNLESHFAKQNMQRMDNANRASYMQVAAYRWLGVRLDALGSVLVLSIAMLSVAQRDSIGAGMAGLIIGYALSMTNIMTWTSKVMASPVVDVHSSTSR